jgi:hypothetical protein
MTTLSDKQLHDLARLGAIARVKELEDEAAALRAMFPGLKKSQDVAPESPEPAGTSKPRKRKERSLASRRAARVRMKLYWAKKRGEQGAPGASSGVAEKADGKALATTTPVAPAMKKKATKKVKKASSFKKAKRAKKKA